MDRRRKKPAKTCLFALFLLFIVDTYAHAIEFSLRISGALSFINPKHINQTLHGREEFLQKTAESQGWTFLEGEVKDLRLSTSLAGEFIFVLSPRLAVGIGTGYIYIEANEKKTDLTYQRPRDIRVWVHPTKITSYPFHLAGYYFFPLIRQVKLYIRGGGGFIWSTYVERIGYRVQPANTFGQIFQQKATAQGYTLFSSLGFTWDANEFMRFFIEADASLAKISGFEGLTSDGETGTLFFFEQYDSGLDFWQAKNILLKERPTGPDVRSVEEAEVNLGGFSIKVGFIMRF